MTTQSFAVHTIWGALGGWYAVYDDPGDLHQSPVICWAYGHFREDDGTLKPDGQIVGFDCSDDGCIAGDPPETCGTFIGYRHDSQRLVEFVKRARALLAEAR